MAGERLDATVALDSRQNQACIEELSAIMPVSRVMVTEVPLAGLEGLSSAVSAKRVDVLMYLLGTETCERLASSSLELAV